MTVRGRVLGRRRRANVAGGRPHRVPVWLSDEELAVLSARAAEAGGISLQAVLVEAALSPGSGGPSERRAVLEVLFGIYRQVAGVAVNANQMAKATHVGSPWSRADAEGVRDECRRVLGEISGAIDGLAAQGVAAG